MANEPLDWQIFELARRISQFVPLIRMGYDMDEGAIEDISQAQRDAKELSVLLACWLNNRQMKDKGNG